MPRSRDWSDPAATSRLTRSPSGSASPSRTSGGSVAAAAAGPERRQGSSTRARSPPASMVGWIVAASRSRAMASSRRPVAASSPAATSQRAARSGRSGSRRYQATASSTRSGPIARPRHSSAAPAALARVNGGRLLRVPRLRVASSSRPTGHGEANQQDATLHGAHRRNGRMPSGPRSPRQRRRRRRLGRWRRGTRPGRRTASPPPKRDWPSMNRSMPAVRCACAAGEVAAMDRDPGDQSDVRSEPKAGCRCRR